MAALRAPGGAVCKARRRRRCRCISSSRRNEDPDRRMPPVAATEAGPDGPPAWPRPRPRRGTAVQVPPQPGGSMGLAGPCHRPFGEDCTAQNAGDRCVAPPRRSTPGSPSSRWALALVLVPTGPARGATSASVTLDALVAGSDMVVYGRVVGGLSFWDAATRTIWTSTQIAVLDAAKGRPGVTVLVTEPGGVVGDTGHLFPGVPRFAPNQEVVAFLYQAPGDRLRVVGLWQGIYGVSVDPATG